jgi:hypothetical protein
MNEPRSILSNAHRQGIGTKRLASPFAFYRMTRLAPLLVVTMLMATSVNASGFSAAAIPTRIDVVRSEGFMVFGAFGNGAGCTVGNQFFVKIDHPQYKQLYALAVSAYLGKQKIAGYVDVCEAVTWYAAPSTTFDVVSAGSTLMITD